MNPCPRAAAPRRRLAVLLAGVLAAAGCADESAAPESSDTAASGRTETAVGRTAASGDGDPATTEAPGGADPSASPRTSDGDDPAGSPGAGSGGSDDASRTATATGTRDRATAPSSPPAVRFTDVTREAGIDFVHRNGARGDKLLPETMGGGCAFLDYDGDDDQDLLLVSSSLWPGDPAAADQPSTVTLYANDGDGRFTDVTAAAGLDLVTYGMGVAAADYDGDGDSDVFITSLGEDHLLRNDDGVFVDVTEAAGVGGGDVWSTAAAFLDHDGDGDLDLLVGHYVQWTREYDLSLDTRIEGLERAYGPPTSFYGTFLGLWRNEGDGTFLDVAAEAGLTALTESSGRPLCKALAFAVADMDDDGDVDVLVANDTVRNALLDNQGDGTFLERGMELGVAYDRNGKPTGAMGVDVGDHLDDGSLGFFVGNFADEMTSIYVGRGARDFFSEETVEHGVGPASRAGVTFGLFLFDYDLDGRLDLLQTNGDLDPEIDQTTTGRRYLQPTEVFWNAGPDAARRFAAVAPDSLGDLTRPVVGRGAAYADIDGDGDLDVLLTQIGGAPLLLRNDQDLGHHWLRCKLVGDGGNRDAIGAWLELEAGGVTQRRQVMPTRSYLSQVELPVTFGLGAATAVNALRVRWPDGTLQEVDVPAVDRSMTITKPRATGDFARLMNQAKAHIESVRITAGIEAQTAALELRPDSVPGLRNLARAHLARGKPEEAVEPLRRARELDPEAVATIYLDGVTDARQSRFDEAIADFELAASLDPTTAPIRFQLAAAYEAVGRADDALEQLRETVRLDPSHSAAQFRLAMRARQSGDMDEFRARNREFLRLRDIYGDRYQTPLSLEVCAHMNAEGAEPPVQSSAPEPSVAVSYADGSAAILGSLADRSFAAVSVLDMDERGAYVLFAAEADGALSLLRRGDSGVYERQPLELSLPALGEVRASIVGNFHDDVPAGVRDTEVRFRFADVFLLGADGSHLLKRTGDDTFTDVTEAAGLASVTGHAARWVDIEHDGDLDLVVAHAKDVALWQNNGDGTFTEVTRDAGIPETGAAVDVAGVDLDDDAAVDLVIARGDQPTLVMENQRAGRLQPMPEPPGPWPAARRLFIDDLDNDGFADTVLVGADAALVLMERGAARTSIDLGDLDASAGALVDYDNDGWLDLCLAGRSDGAPDEGALRIWRNGGTGTWRDATADLVPDDLVTGPVVDILAADLDDDGDTDLTLRDAEGGLSVLRNDGGDANGQLQMRLVSVMHMAGGIGTRVELRGKDFQVTRWAQHDLPVEIGLRGLDRLDTVQTVWTTGVVDNQMDVSPGAEPLTVVIYTWADTGSCPFVYTWDGRRFRFITDLLGSAAIGMPLSRDSFVPINPVEAAVIGGPESLQPRDGDYLVNVTSELREVSYFDRLRLTAVDHPPGVEIHSTDMIQVPPFRPSELWALGERRPLRRAVGDDGIDRTDAVSEADGVHAPPGPVLPPPVRGTCLPMSLEMDFGELQTDRPLVLALTGWIEYGTASTNIALSQNPTIDVIWPFLEARGGDGEWVQLDVAVGLPAGKNKKVLCDLDGRLPAGADRLRLTTTFELRWDRIALFERVPLSPSAIQETAFATAELGWRGFSDLRRRAPEQPKTPNWDIVSTRPKWRTAVEGWCTAYGDVRELLDDRDGQLVVLNSGDVLELTVPANTFRPIPDGAERTFLVSTVGWVREGDVNTEGEATVWPPIVEQALGLEGSDEEDAWRLRHNRRWVSADRFRDVMETP